MTEWLFLVPQQGTEVLEKPLRSIQKWLSTPVRVKVKSSSGATRPRGDHPGPASCNFLPTALSGRRRYSDLSGVGRRRNLSEAACYRNWPRSSTYHGQVKSSQVVNKAKSSSGATRPRGDHPRALLLVKSSSPSTGSGAMRPRSDHPDPNFFLPPCHPYAGSGEV